MKMSNNYSSSNILIHPSLRPKHNNVSGTLFFSVEIQNYFDVLDAYGSDAAKEAVSILLARIQGAIGTSGIASYNGGDQVDIVTWDAELLQNDGASGNPDSWCDAIAIDLTLNPIETCAGRVHLRTSLSKWLTRPEKFTALNEGPHTPDYEAESAQAERTAKLYRSDMEVISPILSAIGGFRGSGDALDVEVCWRPVGTALDEARPAYFEASIGLITANAQLQTANRITECAERVGLGNLLDQFLVTRVIDELVEARGGVVLAVAVSAKSLTDKQFWSATFDRLGCLPEAARNLIVEVRSDIRDPNDAGIAEAISRLRHFGCRISIRNFGLADASMRWTIASQPDFVVIDSHFAAAIGRGKLGAAALSHLSKFAEALGAEVVIDGIDNPGIAQSLQEFDHYLQRGNWYGTARLSRPWVRNGREQNIFEKYPAP